MNLLRIRQHLQRFVSTYYLLIPVLFKRRRAQHLRKFLNLSARFLNQTGEEYWIDWGTLLGQFRENDIILNDVDIDFGMSEKSYQNVLENKHLVPKGLKLYDSSLHHRGPKIYLSYKGFDADIYFYEDLGDHIRSYEEAKYDNEKQKVPKTLIFPLKHADFLGEQVCIPNQTQEYLEFIYGYIGKDAKQNTETGFWEKI